MRAKPHKTHILSKFLWFVLPFIILAIIATSAVLMVTNYRHFQNTIAQDYENIIKASAGEIELFMGYARKKLQSLAWVLATGKGNLYDQKMALVAFAQVNNEFSQVSLVSPQGRILTTTGFENNLKNPVRTPDETMLQKAREGLNAYSQIRFNPDKLPFVSLTIPFPSFAKSPRIIWGDLNLKYVWEVLEGITIGESGHIHIMDVSGNYVAHRQIDQVLIGTPRVSKKTMQEIRLSLRPVSWVERTTDQTFYCLGSYVPELDWIITLRQPTREIYFYLFRNLYWAALIILVACVLAVVFGWHRIQRFLEPIKTIHHQVRKIGTGDLDQKVSVTTTDEIGDLGIAFNEMTTSLKEKIEKEIETAKDLAHAKNLALLGLSASKVTHEVGNLLNNVGMTTSVLKNETLSQQGALTLSKMEQESARIKAFIQDFLKFAKPPQLRPTPVSLDLIIREVLAMHAHKGDQQGIIFDLKWPSKAPKIQVDGPLLYQVFNNLIKNSTEALTGKGRILVTGQLDNGYLDILIQDNGIGMTSADCERIFEPFFTTKGKSGTGLGMAIVHSIITAHRGSIVCRSEVNKGTCFEIQLPLK